MFVYGVVYLFLLHRWLSFVHGSTTSTSPATTLDTSASTTSSSTSTVETSTAPPVATTTIGTAEYIKRFEIPLAVIGYACIVLFFFCVPAICICDCICRKISDRTPGKSESVQQLKPVDATEPKVPKQQTLEIPNFDKTKHQQPIQTPIIEASMLDPKLPPKYKPSRTSNGRNTAQPRYYTRVSNVT